MTGPFHLFRALGNIAGDTTQLRDAMLEAGVMTPLLRCFYNPAVRQKDMVENSAWLLTTLTRGSPMPDFRLTSACLPGILSRLRQRDLFHDAKVDTCWAVYYLVRTETGTETDATTTQHGRIQAVIDAGVCAPFTRLLGIAAFPLDPVLKAILCIASTHPDALLDTNDSEDGMVLVHVRRLLTLVTDGVSSYARLAMRIMSGLIDGSEDRLRRVLAAGFVAPLTVLLSNGIDPKDREQSAEANAAALRFFCFLLCGWHRDLPKASDTTLLTAEHSAFRTPSPGAPHGASRTSITFFEFLETVTKSGRGLLAPADLPNLPRGIPEGTWILASAVYTSARSAWNSVDNTDDTCNGMLV